MKRFLLGVVGLLFIHFSFAEIPEGYYDSATGSGYTLKTQLFNIIHTHTERTYSDLWTDFQSTDKKENGYVWDMYSDVPGGSPSYDYTFSTNQCGNYSSEGDCYNREHSFPKSWFADATPMYTDLFHLYPTDGYVNGRRGNYPYGEVGNASWTSTNGSKLGACSYPGYTGTVFEPIDEYKGDFARTYFYMATCYENVIAGWEKNTTYSDAVLNGTQGQVYEDWFLNMLIEWNNEDPVSQKEIDRNDAVYSIQGNRNPFIDHPEFVAEIWGGSGNMYPSITNVQISPQNPTSNDIVTVSATIIDSDGTIDFAKIKWSISDSNDPTIEPMTNSGNDFSGTIPAQADGTEVSFIIEAVDNSTDTTCTHEYQYVVSESSGIEDISKLKLKLFPNPAKDYINIQIENFAGELMINVYDIIGSLVYTEKIEFNGQYKLLLGNLDSGLYFVNFVLDKTLITKRIIIEK